MENKLILTTLIILTLIPFTYAANDFAYNRMYDGTQPIDGFNYSINVNSSNYWDTGDHGPLRNVADILHNWLDPTSLLWSNAEHIMDALLDMNGYDIEMEGGNIENVSHIQFNIVGDGCADEGCMEWNPEEGTANIRMPGGNVNLQVGQEIITRARNAEGETIFNCQAVFVSGASGVNIEIQTPVASNILEAPLTFGLATEDIANNNLGFVTLIGKVRDCDTSAWSAGDILYLSATEEGNLTNIKPTSPNTSVIIGVVTVSNANSGIISANPTVLQRLVTHSDVFPNALTNNSIVQYVASNGRFEMTTNPFFDNVTILGDLDMTNGSVLNLWQLVSTDGSRIATGTNPAYSAFSGLDSAEVFSNNQSIGGGVTTHALLSTDPGNEKVLAAWQSGKNNSGQYTRNSGGYFPDLGILNVSILTNIEQMWLNFGISPLADYFSAENKTSVAALWAFEAQKLFLHDDLGNGQLLGEGDFTWIAGDDLDIDLYNGNGVHIKKDVIKEFGFSAGDNITSLNADFDSGVLSPFVQTTDGGIGDWLLDSDISCHSGECARALGGSGSPLRSMQANFSSTNQDNLNLSWWITALQAPTDIFTVDVNNNIGSGDITVFSSSSIFTDEYQSVILPSSMDNISIVTVKFNFQGNNINNDVVYVDEVLVVGNATITTLANVTVEDASLLFGDKACGIELSAEDGYQDLNITCDNINLIGNVTAISVTEVSVNVTDSIIAGGNITTGDRFFLGNGASIGYNSSCAFVFYNQTGSVISTLGCT